MTHPDLFTQGHVPSHRMEIAMLFVQEICSRQKKAAKRAAVRAWARVVWQRN
jgi:hypothetical protein